MWSIWPRKTYIVKTIIDQLLRNHKSIHRFVKDDTSMSDADRKFGYMLFICLSVEYWILTHFKSSSVSFSTTFTLLDLKIDRYPNMVEILCLNECIELLLSLHFEDTEGHQFHACLGGVRQCIKLYCFVFIRTVIIIGIIDTLECCSSIEKEIAPLFKSTNLFYINTTNVLNKQNTLQ